MGRRVGQAFWYTQLYPRLYPRRVLLFHGRPARTPPSPVTEHLDALCAVFMAVQRQRPFHLDAIVILPDHLHCIWRLLPDDADYSTRWRLLKASFARAIAPGERLSERSQRKGERG